jgi:hypothetical protein
VAWLLRPPALPQVGAAAPPEPTLGAQPLVQPVAPAPSPGERPAERPTATPPPTATPMPAPTPTPQPGVSPFATAAPAPTAPAIETPRPAPTPTPAPEPALAGVFETRSAAEFHVSPEETQVTVAGQLIGIADDWDGMGGGKKYVFPGPGAYLVKLSLPGYQTAWVKVVVAPTAKQEVVDVDTDLEEVEN